MRIFFSIHRDGGGRDGGGRDGGGYDGGSNDGGGLDGGGRDGGSRHSGNYIADAIQPKDFIIFQSKLFFSHRVVSYFYYFILGKLPVLVINIAELLF